MKKNVFVNYRRQSQVYHKIITYDARGGRNKKSWKAVKNREIKPEKKAKKNNSGIIIIGHVGPIIFPSPTKFKTSLISYPRIKLHKLRCR